MAEGARGYVGVARAGASPDAGEVVTGGVVVLEDGTKLDLGDASSLRPERATGAYLDRLAEVYGLQRRAAAPSVGDREPDADLRDRLLRALMPDAATVRQLLAGDPVPGLVPGRRAHLSEHHDPDRRARRRYGQRWGVPRGRWQVATRFDRPITLGELRARVAAARARADWGAPLPLPREVRRGR